MGSSFSKITRILGFFRRLTRGKTLSDAEVAKIHYQRLRATAQTRMKEISGLKRKIRKTTRRLERIDADLDNMRALAYRISGIAGREIQSIEASSLQGIEMRLTALDRSRGSNGRYVSTRKRNSALDISGSMQFQAESEKRGQVVSSMFAFVKYLEPEFWIRKIGIDEQESAQ